MTEPAPADAAVAAFTWSDDHTPTTALIEAIAEETGEDATRLSPLYEAVDPDALDRMFASDAGERSDGRVAFPFHGYWVEVTAGGDGRLYERRTDAAA